MNFDDYYKKVNTKKGIDSDRQNSLDVEKPRNKS